MVRLVLALALSAVSARAQTPPPGSTPAQTTPTKATTAKKKAAAKSGKAAASTESGVDLDDASRREIHCPPGFVPEKTGGPHLQVMQKKRDLPAARHRKKGSPGYADDDEVVPTRKTMARRCVPSAALEKKKAPAASPTPSSADPDAGLRPAN